jgi:transposase
MNKAYMKGNKPDMKKRIRIMTLYVEYGYNCSQIAKKVGVSRQAVRQILVRCGIPIRPRGRPTR